MLSLLGAALMVPMVGLLEVAFIAAIRKAQVAAFESVRELSSMYPDGNAGGAMQIEVWNHFDPDSGDPIPTYKVGLSNLAGGGTLGPG